VARAGINGPVFYFTNPPKLRRFLNEDFPDCPAGEVRAGFTGAQRATYGRFDGKSTIRVRCFARDKMLIRRVSRVRGNTIATTSASAALISPSKIVPCCSRSPAAID
jgi:hypothetical protein